MNGESGKSAAGVRPGSRLRAGRRPRAGRRLRASDDSGMTAIEFVVMTPLMFMLLMLTVQFAMYLFAKQAAEAAVQGGARVAREEAAQTCTSAGGGPVDPVHMPMQWQQDAVKTATDRATQLGGSLLTMGGPGTGVTVDGTMDPALNAACKISLVTVKLDADMPSIVPWMHMQVHVKAGGPLEQGVVHK